MHNAALAKEWTAARNLPYRAAVSEHNISLDGGGLLTVLKLEGVAHETADDDDLVLWHRALNNTLMAIAEPDVALWRTTHHYLVEGFAPGQFEPGFASDLNDAYRQRCEREQLFANDLYLTVLLRGPGTLDKMFAGKKTQAGAKQALEERSGRLDLLAMRMQEALARYRPRRLGLVQERNVVFSETLAFLALVLNGRPARVAVTPHRAADLIGRARLTFGGTSFVRDHTTERSWGAMLSASTYPKYTAPGQLNKTLSLPFPCVITNAFTFLGQQAAQDAVVLQGKRMRASGDAATHEIAAFAQLQAELQSRDVGLGQHDLTICVTGGSADELDRRLAMAEENCTDVGFKMVREDTALQAAFFSQMPGVYRLRPRRAPITTRNFAGLASLHNYPTGRREGNQWGPATTMLLTEAGSPFYASLHDMRKARTRSGAESEDDKAPGNTLVLGPTGGGKTTIQTFLVAQSDKAQPTVFTFDKSRGQEIFVRAMGGRYTLLQTGRPTGFNFLRLEPTAANIGFATSMAQSLAAGGTPLTPTVESRIAERVRFVMLEEAYDERSLTHVASALDPREESTMRLQQWCEGGSHAWAFPSGEDSLNLSDYRHYGFDATDFLENPLVRVPIMNYLFHRVDSFLGTRPVILNIDEMKAFLRDPFFTEFIEKELLLIRKKDAIAILGTQQVSHVLESSIADALIEQTQTKLLLPNPQGNARHYIDGLGLSAQEFELIQRTLPERNPRGFLFKQPGVSTVCNLNLAGMKRELAVLSGTDPLIAKMERAIGQVGEDPRDWLPVYYDSIGRG